ncbi:hypothetical protein CDD81_1187 [Ophiocordyceps australis]|uniref:Fe2OG dioxygenase domain-containing protein n=1 Tax=Ophiocordyceps australis TaxID=1399860 RepID=A0A2C5XKN1_9HYPO|nr:hypothetical protein CDD81_1187 [Ophiocordyceps australis]
MTETRPLVPQARHTLVAQETFSSIPVLDFRLSQSPESKPLFLSQLREALVIVGFFYLKNPPVPQHVRNSFVEKSIELCDLPLDKKLKIDMINSKHFLGYSRRGLEKTARRTDNREMFDFLTPLPAPGPDEPIYLNVQGPSQWPEEQDVPGFRPAIENYLFSIGELGKTMTSLVAEALDLEPSAFTHLFNRDVPRNKVSLLKYPEPADDSDASPGLIQDINSDGSFQGVGPHKDGGFLTFLLQATAHAGLEAQNKAGRWISIPPIPNTLVINVGRSLESLTAGVCTATTHRVNLRPSFFFDRHGRCLGPRYSYPVFQTLRVDVTHQELTSIKLPKHITDLVKDEKIKSDAEAYFAKYHLQSPGKGIFMARLTSHPEVGRRWYPEQLAEALKGQREFSS